MDPAASSRPPSKWNAAVRPVPTAAAGAVTDGVVSVPPASVYEADVAVAPVYDCPKTTPPWAVTVPPVWTTPEAVLAKPAA